MQNKNDDWFVHDARNGNVTGPYRKDDAQAAAVTFNAFVHKNSALGFMQPISITGPFYARPTEKRLF